MNDDILFSAFVASSLCTAMDMEDCAEAVAAREFAAANPEFEKAFLHALDAPGTEERLRAYVRSECVRVVAKFKEYVERGSV